MLYNTFKDYQTTLHPSQTNTAYQSVPSHVVMEDATMKANVIVKRVGLVLVVSTHTAIIIAHFPKETVLTRPVYAHMDLLVS